MLRSVVIGPHLWLVPQALGLRLPLVFLLATVVVLCLASPHDLSGFRVSQHVGAAFGNGFLCLIDKLYGLLATFGGALDLTEIVGKLQGGLAATDHAADCCARCQVDRQIDQPTASRFRTSAETFVEVRPRAVAAIPLADDLPF